MCFLRFKKKKVLVQQRYNGEYISPQRLKDTQDGLFVSFYEYADYWIKLNDDKTTSSPSTYSCWAKVSGFENK